MARKTALGKAFIALRVIRTYKNGDGEGFVWRYWNPLSWLAGPILFVLNCILAGVPEAWHERHYCGFGMNPWFIEHPERLEWLN